MYSNNNHSFSTVNNVNVESNTKTINKTIANENIIDISTKAEETNKQNNKTVSNNKNAQATQNSIIRTKKLNINKDINTTANRTTKKQKSLTNRSQSKSTNTTPKNSTNSKGKYILSKTSYKVSTTKIATTTKSSKKVEVRNTNNPYLETPTKDNTIFSDFKILRMALIEAEDNRATSNFIYNPKYKIVNNKERNIYSDYEIIMGPNLNYSLFELNKNNISDKELSKKSLLPSYHFGGNYNLYYKDWIVRTGINYNTIKEQINFTTTSLSIDSTVSYYTIISNTYNWDTTGWNTNVNGTNDSIPIVTLAVHHSNTQNTITDYDSTIISQNLQYRNTYSSINIPLLIGRRFTFERFTFDVATGISWSHITQYQTHILDPISGEVISLNQENGNLKKDVFNGVISIGAGYRLNGINTIFIRPELQYNINSIFDKANFTNYKVYQMRFSVGLRYSIK